MRQHLGIAASTYNPFDSDLFPDIDIDAGQATNFVLGMVIGMQYTDDSPSDCFYTVLDTVASLDYFRIDAENLLTNYQFYPLLVYDPIHFYGNMMSVYE